MLFGSSHIMLENMTRVGSQAFSALHTMAVLQVYQAKLLHDMDESGPDPAMFKELRSAMASLVVLACHLCINFTEIKNADRRMLLDSPISLSGLIASVVDGFAERCIAAQKSLQASCRKEPVPPLPPVTPRRPIRLSSDPDQPQRHLAPAESQPEVKPRLRPPVSKVSRASRQSRAGPA
ncbi:hypothetical protein DPX16_23014 [Anabarilius grahami]|uniref:Uncharacterized protein n=1 Tax=Anabarilius grahami TaxID=495550 RepID=A0A3N0XK41_ANAGA|nr:hypothetical protein DPX16_23014 [Anabarilius grahami]